MKSKVRYGKNYKGLVFTISKVLSSDTVCLKLNFSFYGHFNLLQIAIGERDGKTYIAKNSLVCFTRLPVSYILLCRIISYACIHAFVLG